MADDIQRGLVEAAEALARRKLGDSEKKELIDRYYKETGTRRERATRSIGRTLGITPEGIRQRRASDDNADRIVTDLENLLGK